MGIAERKEREKQQRRTRIVDAAEEVIFSKGYDNATMDEVAEEAELSKGTLYLYFKSKEELYHAIILRGMKILENLFRKATSINDHGLHKVREIGKSFISFHIEYEHYYGAFVYHQAKQFHPDNIGCCEIDILNCKQNIMGIFLNALKEGMHDGSIRPDIDPGKTALILWGQTTGLVQLIKMKAGILDHLFNFTKEELLDYYFEFTFHSLANK